MSQPSRLTEAEPQFAAEKLQLSYVEDIRQRVVNEGRIAAAQTAVQRISEKLMSSQDKAALLQKSAYESVDEYVQRVEKWIEITRSDCREQIRRVRDELFYQYGTKLPHGQYLVDFVARDIAEILADFSQMSQPDGTSFSFAEKQQLTRMVADYLRSTENIQNRVMAAYGDRNAEIRLSEILSSDEILALMARLSSYPVHELNFSAPQSPGLIQWWRRSRQELKDKNAAVSVQNKMRAVNESGKGKLEDLLDHNLTQTGLASANPEKYFPGRGEWLAQKCSLVYDNQNYLALVQAPDVNEQRIWEEALRSFEVPMLIDLSHQFYAAFLPFGFGVNSEAHATMREYQAPESLPAALRNFGPENIEGHFAAIRDQLNELTNQKQYADMLAVLLHMDEELGWYIRQLQAATDAYAHSLAAVLAEMPPAYRRIQKHLGAHLQAMEALRTTVEEKSTTIATGINQMIAELKQRGGDAIGLDKLLRQFRLDWDGELKLSDEDNDEDEVTYQDDPGSKRKRLEE